MGEVECLGVRHLPPRSGEGPWYFNALAILRSDSVDDRVRAALRAIEARLGRDRAIPERVAIDIDVLARRGDLWIADPHALAKGELDRYPAANLLAEAGIMVCGCDPRGP